ncbi:MAG: Kelch repeat-containing protein [Promethearchaeota archaeon]
MKKALKFQKSLFVFLLLLAVFYSPKISRHNAGTLAARNLPSSSPSNRYSPAMVYDSDNLVTLIFGGASDNQNNHLNDTWILDYTTRSWTKLNPINSPSARFNAGIVYDSYHKKVILFGGTSEGTFKADTWIFDFQSNQWTEVFPETSPPRHVDPAMIFDPINNRAIIFGGFAGVGSYLDETWGYYYANNTWVKLNPSSKPPARYGHGFVYDSHSQKGILFGGRAQSRYDDTWFYDPILNSWHELIPENKPERRYWHRMIYDSINQKTILFGGDNPYSDPTSGRSKNDTWFYDYVSNQWTEANPEVSPSARMSQGMVYDSTNHKVILFGGVCSLDHNHPFNDTWVYDYGNNNWVKLKDIPLEESSITEMSTSHSSTIQLSITETSTAQLSMTETSTTQLSATKSTINSFGLLIGLISVITIVLISKKIR